MLHQLDGVFLSDSFPEVTNGAIGSPPPEMKLLWIDRYTLGVSSKMVISHVHGNPHNTQKGLQTIGRVSRNVSRACRAFQKSLTSLSMIATA